MRHKVYCVVDVGGGDGFAWAIAFNVHVLQKGDHLVGSSFVANEPLVELEDPLFYRITPKKWEQVSHDWVPTHFQKILERVALGRAVGLLGDTQGA